MEVICKTVSFIIDNRLGKAIKFHNVLHGFRANRRKVTAYIEAKLRQQLVLMR